MLASLPTLRHLQLSFWQGAIVEDCLLSQLPDEVAKVLPSLTNLTSLELQVRNSPVNGVVTSFSSLVEEHW